VVHDLPALEKPNPIRHLDGGRPSDAALAFDLVSRGSILFTEAAPGFTEPALGLGRSAASPSRSRLSQLGEPDCARVTSDLDGYVSRSPHIDKVPLHGVRPRVRHCAGPSAPHSRYQHDFQGSEEAHRRS
jgi:hypothetical protein